MEKTAEDLCRELWQALDTRVKTMPFGPNVKEAMTLVQVGQRMVMDIEAMLRLAKVMNVEIPPV